MGTYLSSFSPSLSLSLSLSVSLCLSLSLLSLSLSLYLKFGAAHEKRYLMALGKEHRQFRGAFGRWRTAAIDRTTFQAFHGKWKVSLDTLKRSRRVRILRRMGTVSKSATFWQRKVWIQRHFIGEKLSCKFLARKSANFFAIFSATKMTSLPSHSLCTSLSLTERTSRTI